jgi:zinc protease
MRYILTLLIGIFIGSLDAAIVPQTATLSNGLKIIVFQNPLLPSVNVFTKYGVGTADDPAEMVGVSHMLEHMMFKGSSKYSKGAIDTILNSCGGVCNAFTNFDNTVYTFALPAEHLDIVLDIEADRMENLNIDEAEFLSEQKVVMEERQMRLGNHPFRTSAEICLRAMYAAHPYGIFPIGYEAHIKAYTAEALMAHYKKWYVPNNATIVVIGPYDLAYVLPKIEEHFSNVSSKELQERRRISEPDREGLTTTIEQENPRAENIYISISYRAPTLITKPKEYLAMNMLEKTMNGSDHALYQKMVKEKHLALAISSSYRYGKDDMDFTFTLILSPDMNVDAAEKFLFEQLAVFLKKGLVEKDFNDAKQEQLNAFAFAMDGEAFLMSIANSVLDGFPLEAVSKYEDILKAVTVQQVHEMLSSILAKPPVLISRNYPKGKMPKRAYQKVLQKGF